MRARSWLVESLAGLAILITLVNGVRAQSPRSASKPAAVVDGTPITMAEVESILKKAGPTATALTDAQRKQLQLEALGMLIDDLLMERFLRKNAPPIDPAEVNKKFAELKDSLKQQSKSMEDFYRESGENEMQVRTNLVNMLQWAAYVKGHLTEAEIKRYYDDNRDFFDRVSVRASHIVLRAPASLGAGEREQARTQLQSLRQQIVSGKLDFAEAAKKHSQCTSRRREAISVISRGSWRSKSHLPGRHSP